MKPKEIYSPYCLVSFLYYEANGKKLFCERCIFADQCEKYRAAKEFISTSPKGIANKQRRKLL